jgi:4'-phosphopantetheinyl transferase
MNDLYHIKPQTIHLWQILLTDFIAEEQRLFHFLSEDEVARALRFHLPLHRQRYIITRGLLRKLLSLYTTLSPDKIALTYGEKGKPYLRENPLSLQFNLSHSDERAIYGFTLHHEIGVDIQKTTSSFNEGVAKRFFSASEIAELLALPTHERAEKFYQIWTKKEALIKAIGGSVFSSFMDFSVSLTEVNQPIKVKLPQGDGYFYVKNISLQNADDYQAAFSACTPLEVIVKQF